MEGKVVGIEVGMLGSEVSAGNGGMLRVVPIVCVGQPSTSDETRASLGY